MGDVAESRGRQHGHTVAAVEWVIGQVDPVTVVTSTETAAEWWRQRLAGTRHSVILVDSSDPERRLRPVQGRGLFFDMFHFGFDGEPEG